MEANFDPSTPTDFGVSPMLTKSRRRFLIELPLAAAVLRTSLGEDFGAVTQQSTQEAREAVAARYRVLVESKEAAQGR